MTRASLATSICLAAAIPALLAYNLPPSATLLNQAVALLGWGGAAAFVAIQSRAVRGQADAGLRSLFAAFVLVIAAPVSRRRCGPLKPVAWRYRVPVSRAARSC